MGEEANAASLTTPLLPAAPLAETAATGAADESHDIFERRLAIEILGATEGGMDVLHTPASADYVRQPVSLTASGR